jgi:hypothetical protein
MKLSMYLNCMLKDDDAAIQAAKDLEYDAEEMTESACTWKKACILMQLESCHLKPESLKDKEVMETIQSHVCEMYDKAAAWWDYDELALLK